jgi:hypothetical protein
MRLSSRLVDSTPKGFNLTSLGIHLSTELGQMRWKAHWRLFSPLTAVFLLGFSWSRISHKLFQGVKIFEFTKHCKMNNVYHSTTCAVWKGYPHLCCSVWSYHLVFHEPFSRHEIFLPSHQPSHAFSSFAAARVTVTIGIDLLFFKIRKGSFDLLRILVNRVLSNNNLTKDRSSRVAM